MSGDETTADDIAAAFLKVTGRPLTPAPPDRRSTRQVEIDEREIDRYIQRIESGHDHEQP